MRWRGICRSVGHVPGQLVDHVRLSFASALAAYEGHAEAAAKHGAVELLREAGAASVSGLAAIFGAIATRRVSLAGRDGGPLRRLFGTAAAYVSLNQQPLVYGHRVSAAKLWVICEKYRALLAEMHDGSIDLPALQQRRNALLNEAASVLEQAAPDDRYTYEIAREALSGPKGAGYPDWLIDRYLPAGLRKDRRSRRSRRRDQAVSGSVIAAPSGRARATRGGRAERIGTDHQHRRAGRRDLPPRRHPASTALPTRRSTARRAAAAARTRGSPDIPAGRTGETRRRAR